MSQLAPLTVAVPLLGAALLSVAHVLLGRAVADALAIAAAVATMVMTLLLLVHVGDGLTVYWFGGWHPRAGVAIGIDFAVGPIGAGLATFVSLLMVLALIYGSRHVSVEHPYYQVLMLTFLAGMIGFCLSGDLFNMFVMFEVMSVSAVALVGYKVHERAALEGGLNFAVINTIGAFLFLLGIGVLYGHTGALNLAQIGRALHHSGNSRVVVVAFVLIASALLIKAAIVPFHFWLADAYAVALSPVCILLAGAMSEMGIYGLARIWFTAFSPALGGHAATLRVIFVGAGIITALWGAAMALSEDHLKRMLAFTTIALVGVYLIGVGLLSEDGIAAVAVFVVGDGFVKALLFACVGILQQRTGWVSQRRLHGRGRHLRVTGLLFAAGGLLMASLPPFGSFLGKSMLDDAAIKAGYSFLPPLVMLVSAMCGAAVLRAGARIFLGWGPAPAAQDETDDDTEPEADAVLDRTPALMLIPVLGLLVGAIGTGAWPGFAGLAASAAHRFVDVSGYATIVYGGSASLHSVGSSAPEWFDYLYGGGASVLALAIVALDLWGERPTQLWGAIQGAATQLVRPLRSVHSGKIGDYTAALTLGVGVLGALIALTLG
ncbi:MAG TPA: proton-conducting transporter membrane subunit [Solirubrobacteraceae bacterium]|nr:proton-conducting transporter membrane subunit [Solirubrobacteraceae bacterium]